MKALILLFITLFASCSLLATPPIGVGSHKSITGSIPVGSPPGLKGKSMPHGLQMRNKTPYGWSQGKKTGWNKSTISGKKSIKNKNLRTNPVRVLPKNPIPGIND